MTTAYSSDQIANALQDLPHWKVREDGKAIEREIIFPNFIHAMGFMTSAAIEAEKMNHHPEWSNVYRTVSVTLTTHSEKGVTDLDIRLAQKFDALTS